MPVNKSVNKEYDTPRRAHLAQFETIRNSPETIQGLAVENLPIGTIGAILEWGQSLQGDEKKLSYGTIVEVTGEPVIEENTQNPQYTRVTVPVRCYPADLELNKFGDISTGRLRVTGSGTLRDFERVISPETAEKLRAGFTATSNVASDMNNRAKEALVTP